MDVEEVSSFAPTVIRAVGLHWRLVVVVVVALVLPAGVLAFTRAAGYAAAASLTVGDPRGPGVLNGRAPEVAERYAADQLVVFRSAAFAAHAARRGLEQEPPLRRSARWFLAHVSVSGAAADNNLLSVSFSAPSAAEATAGARATVAAYGDVTRTAMAGQAKAILRQLDSTIRILDSQLRRLRDAPIDPTAADQTHQLLLSRSALAARRDQVAGEAAFPASGVVQSLLPMNATASGNMPGLRLIVLALTLGLALGVGLAYLRASRKLVFTDRRDPELLLNAPLLTDVSSLRTVDLVGLTPESDAPRAQQVAQDMFGLAASVLADRRFDYGEDGMSLAIVSAKDGPICAAVAWRSALELAARGLCILLIDADGSQQPAPVWTARVTGHLAWVARGDHSVTLDERPRDRLASPTRSGFYFCGEPPPVPSQKALKALFRELERDFDIVFVNTPALLPTARSAHLASAAGTAMVVVPQGGSVADHAEVVRRLRLAAATTLGYVYCCAGCDNGNWRPGMRHRLTRAIRSDERTGRGEQSRSRRKTRWQN